MLGLAIMMASRWKRPSATNTIASAPSATTGAVQPSTSPAGQDILSLYERWKNRSHYSKNPFCHPMSEGHVCMQTQTPN